MPSGSEHCIRLYLPYLGEVLADLSVRKYGLFMPEKSSTVLYV